LFPQEEESSAQEDIMLIYPSGLFIVERTKPRYNWMRARLDESGKAGKANWTGLNQFNGIKVVKEERRTGEKCGNGNSIKK
jgi:hypothetical protein